MMVPVFLYSAVQTWHEVLAEGGQEDRAEYTVTDAGLGMDVVPGHNTSRSFTPTR